MKKKNLRVVVMHGVVVGHGVVSGQGQGVVVGGQGGGSTGQPHLPVGL